MTVDSWRPWYRGVTQRRPYLIAGDDATYRMGAEWLKGLEVADWGCGLGWMRNYVPEHLYTGVDGTASVFADVVADLATYRVPSQAVFMRHVLEHDEHWESILRNAVAASEERLFLVLYTPPADVTHVHLYEPTLGVPEIRFAVPDILDLLKGDVTVCKAGTETVFLVQK